MNFFCSFDPEDLERKAVKLGAFNKTAITTGNTIAIFAMLVLQEILEQLALNPAANLSKIIMVTNSIANLNSRIIVDP